MGKQAVFINVDETSISLARPDLKGNIVPGTYSLQQKGKHTRGALTHVASICNRSDIQPCLPQVILSNTHVVSQKLAKSFCCPCSRKQRDWYGARLAGVQLLPS